MTSYTPTVQALLHSRRAAQRRLGPGRALIVASPDGLPSARREALRLHEILPDSVLLLDEDEGGPTKATVLRHLPEASLVHFACHAVADPVEPADSRLVLGGRTAEPLTVNSLDAARLDNAQLAFLSACTTAMSHNAALVDESAHLAAAFQLCGFPHVVGTLWEVADDPATRISRAFYREVRAGSPGFDPAMSATALHRAVRAARDHYRGSSSAWASHVHFGA